MNAKLFLSPLFIKCIGLLLAKRLGWFRRASVRTRAAACLVALQNLKNEFRTNLQIVTLLQHQGFALCVLLSLANKHKASDRSNDLSQNIVLQYWRTI